MTRPSTIEDVARVAGVSPATVSRALRGHERVLPDTRARVLKAAEELEYVASPTAQGLASGRTKVIAVVVPFLSRWYFAELVSSLDRTLRDHGYHVLIIDLEAHHYDERHSLDSAMLSKRADGLITVAIRLSEPEQQLIDRLRIPGVAVGQPVGQWPCIRVDDREAAATATRHVVGLGHRRIAFLGSANTTDPAHSTPAERTEGFLATLKASGIDVDPAWLLETDWTADGAAAVSERLLRAVPRPTAVVCGSDEIAIGVIAAARRLGLGVPADLSVVGIDDHHLSGVLGITTVRQDVRAQGREAALAVLVALDAVVADEAAATPAKILPTELVVRGTTAPPPAVDKRQRHTLRAGS
jgi:DNA-binding LacI/PurR family transcriptional regulator